MRDPDRIPDFMETFQELWLRHPKLRFGQLVEIIKYKNDHTDIFYMKDNEILKIVKDILNKGL